MISLIRIVMLDKLSSVRATLVSIQAGDGGMERSPERVRMFSMEKRSSGGTLLHLSLLKRSR